MNYPRRLTGRVTLLGNRYVSMYLIQGRTSYAMVETGILGTAVQIVDQDRSLNVDLSEIRTVLITHAHADHVTGHLFSRKSYLDRNG